MWIKVCGITSQDDAEVVAGFSPDAIGFVFYPPSPRHVTGELARSIANVLPAGIRKVGVFVDPDWKEVERLLRMVPLDMIQWHGEPVTQELQAQLGKLGIPWIEVKKIAAGASPSLLSINPSPRASYLLVEGFSPKSPGGNAHVWDHSLISGIPFPVPLILSGGLNDTNVHDAIKSVRPYGVDVSSGVESSPGKKDYDRLSRFFSEVKRYE
ncbi:MAG: phosphoribosylanthranilate isomerase [Leptospirales bacterium]